MADHEVDLAESAKRYFEEQSFESCLTTVNKLCELKKLDPKVLHNRAVAHYYLSNLTLTDEFKKVLDQVDQQMSREAEETGLDLSSVDKSVLLYNQSVLLFHLRQYSEAVRPLEKLLVVRQSLEEVLAYKVAFMCLDIYLKTYRNEAATEMITYLDNLLFGMRQDPSLELSFSSNTEIYKPLMHQFRARAFLATRQLKTAKREVKSLSLLVSQPPQGGAGEEIDPSRPPPPEPILSPTLIVSSVFLKSNYEFLRGNYRKSLKLLGTAPRTPFLTESGECLPSLYFNAVACCHTMMGKHTLAAFYYRKALEENDRALTDFPPTDRSAPLAGRPLAVLGVNRHYELLYHLGLQLLFSGKPSQAFEALIGAVQVFRTNPHIWHRLAETCIAAKHLKEKEQTRQQRNLSSTVQVVEGYGINRKLLLAPMRLQTHIPVLGQEVHPSMALPTLEFGALCVKNALYLLSNPKRDSSSTGSHHSSMPCPPLSLSEADSLSMTLLACGAYISLGLCDPIVALDYATQLLESPSITPQLSFLGRMYKAEALILNGSIQEASELVSPETIQDSWFSEMVPEPEDPTPQIQQSQGDTTKEVQKAAHKITCKNEFPNSGNQARVISYLNLCSVFSMAGEFEKARKCLISVSALGLEDTPPQAVLLSVYIELQTGNVYNALQLIKRHQYVLASRLDKKKAKKL